MIRKTFAYEYRWQIAAVLAAGFAVNFAALGFVTFPLRYGTASLAEALRSEENRLAARRAERRHLAETEAGLDKTRDDVKWFYESVLSTKKEKMTPFQKELRRMAQDTSVSFPNVGYGVLEIKNSGGLVHFSANLPLEGTYDSLKRFIAAVETNRNIFIVIDSLKLRNNPADKFDRLKMGLVVSTYFKAGEGGAPAGAAAEASVEENT